jgi:hypothetical protein
MNALVMRYKAMPRSGRWLVALVAFVGVFFLVVDPLLARWGQYRVDADQIENSLANQARLRTELAESSRTIEQVAALFGRPALPGSVAEASAGLEQRINRIFAAHKVANLKTSYRDPVVMSNVDAPAIVGTGQKLNRLVAEMSFETDTANLSAILRDLEESAEIASVTRVSVRKLAAGRGAKGDTGGSLQVSLNAEAWGVGSSRSPARPASSNGGEP